MAQSRIHNVSTIFSRLEGLLKSGTIKKNDVPLWFQVYRRFPPQRPPDSERPLIQKPLKTILYPEDDLRAQFFKTYHNSNMTGEIGLVTTTDFTGGIGEAFLKSFAVLRRLRPQYREDDLWYLTQRWMEDGLGVTLTHRGDKTTSADVKNNERAMAKIETLNEEEMMTFVEKIEKEELGDEEEEENEEEVKCS